MRRTRFLLSQIPLDRPDQTLSETQSQAWKCLVGSGPCSGIWHLCVFARILLIILSVYCLDTQHKCAGPAVGLPNQYEVQSWPKKRSHRLMTIFLSYLNRSKKNNGKFLGKFAVKWIITIPPHLACVATLPCETLMSAKEALNEKLRGSVAAYLRCGGVVDNKLRKVYCWVCEWNFFIFGD